MPELLWHCSSLGTPIVGPCGPGMTLLDLYRSCNHDKRLYYKLPNETFQLQNIVIDMLTFVKQSVMDSRHIPVSWPPLVPPSRRCMLRKLVLTKRFKLTSNKHEYRTKLVYLSMKFSFYTIRRLMCTLSDNMRSDGLRLDPCVLQQMQQRHK